MTIGPIGRALVAGLATLLLALPLAACGSSSDDAGTAAASTTANATTTAAGLPGARDRAALAACMRDQGVELPRPSPRARTFQREGGRGGDGAPDRGFGRGGEAGRGARFRGPAGSARGGFAGRFSGADRSRVQAAFQKCGGRFGRFTRGGGPAGARAGAPSRAVLERFVACVRSHGYDLPDPNVSGRGAVFDDARVDRDDPVFQRASRACQQLLQPQQ
jgi:hypothetical protein